PSQLGHQVVGNIVAKLTDNAEFERGWKFLVFHSPAVWQVCGKFPTVFSNSCGMAVNLFGFQALLGLTPPLLKPTRRCFHWQLHWQSRANESRRSVSARASRRRAGSRNSESKRRTKCSPGSWSAFE